MRSKDQDEISPSPHTGCEPVGGAESKKLSTPLVRRKPGGEI